MAFVDISGGAGIRLAPAQPGPAGLEIGPDSRLDDLDLSGVAAIAIRLPVFSDGRVYSLARKLRGERGFAGRLWVVGDVLVDQLHLLARVGFDGFALKPGQDPDRAVRALTRYGAVYQAGADGRAPASALRHRFRAA